MATYGLEEVHNGENASVDIVFLHGLRGNTTDTWVKNGVLWPRDLLADDISDSRIFLFGFDSGIVHLDQSNVTLTELESDAEDLCAKLAAERSKTNTVDRPLIFVAHSLGGLVAAQALIFGERRAPGDSAQVIAQQLRGMVFLGTPFRGSTAARPADIVRRILGLFGVTTQESTLKLLGVDSERLNELNVEFPEAMRKRITSKSPGDKLDAVFFYETLKTMGIQVVEPYSAKVPGCGESAPIRANHLDICKFKSKKDEGYEVIVAAIRKFRLPAGGESSEEGQRIINNWGHVVNLANGNVTVHSQTNTFGK